MGQQRTLVKGIFQPVGHNPERGHHSRIINATSKKRVEPILHSKLDGLLTSKNPKICVYRRLGGIGDVIMTTPMLKHIKRLFPNCHLVYATDLKYANGALGDVLRGNPFIDEIVSYKDVSAKDFDLFTDVTVTGLSKEKPGKAPPNRIDMFAAQIGVDVSSDPVPTYIVLEDEKIWASKKGIEFSLPHKREDVVIVGIQTRSNDGRRTWPLEHSLTLVNMLIKDPKIRVVIFDWENDIKWHLPQTFVSKETFRYTAALVNECDIMVTPDSSLLHLAGALQKKTIAIFGPIPPESRINHYVNTTAVVAGLPCQYCFYSPTCGGRNPCLTSITPKTVYVAIKGKIAEETQVQEVITIQDGRKTGFQPDNVILVKRHYGGFGDILMTLPGIEALKNRYPTKKIYYALPEKYWPAAENNPYIDKLIDIDKPIQQNRYSVIIDISSPCAQYEASRVSQRKPIDKSRIEVFAAALGTSQFVTSLKPKYYITPEESKWAENWLPLTDKPRVGIVLRCAEEYRNWPIEKYEKLIQIISNKYQCIIIDGVRDFSIPNTIDACGFPFRKGAVLLSKCDAIITPDTSMVHISAALNIPCVALFGPIDPKARCKGYSNVKVLVSNLDCVPCWRNSVIPCKITKKVRGCSECMEKIPVESVYQTLNSLLAKGKNND